MFSGDIDFNISLNKKSFLEREPIWVKCQVRNNGSTPQNVLSVKHPIIRGMVFYLISEDPNSYLQDISINITRYFKFIKKMYEILSCYKVLNYHDASDKIFEFVRDIKTENFPNLKRLISLTYQNLVRNRLCQCSKDCDKLSISTLSKRMAMDQEQLIEFINLIQKQPKSPIQNYISRTQEIVFKKSDF